MKLDGALKPQGAIPYVIVSSIGAKNHKYRDKFYSNNFTIKNTNNKNNKINYNKNKINFSQSNISSNCNNTSNNSQIKNYLNLFYNKKQNSAITPAATINNKNYFYCIKEANCNSANAKANNINKNFNDNLTKAIEIKGFQKSLKVENNINNNNTRSSNNNNNNIEINNIRNKSYCCKNQVKEKKTTSIRIENTSGLKSNHHRVNDSNINVINNFENKKSQKLSAAISDILKHQKFHLIKIKMRSIQSSIASSASTISMFYFLFFFALTTSVVKCDENDFFSFNSYSLSPDSAQADFDYASRGQKYFGDKCDNTLQCGFPGSICDGKKKTCRCTDDLPATNHYDKCGRIAAFNESCFFNEQCETFSHRTECRDGHCICKYDWKPSYHKGEFDCIYEKVSGINETCFFNEQCETFSHQTECRDTRCICKYDLQPVFGTNGNFEECGAKQLKAREVHSIDPAMIGVLVGMALMFIIICVVLRLFSQARWHENRTIFNTPNPRLMNVSLLRESKHGQERRGSRMSVRGPSRQPSMASLRPHSPNPSLASRNSNSNGSVASIRSRCDSVAAVSLKGHHAPHHHHHGNRKSSLQSNQQTPLITHVIPNPTPENVTIEIIEPTTKTTSNHTDI